MVRRFRLALISIFLGLLFVEVWLGFPVTLESGPAEDPNINKPITGGPEAEKHMEGVHFVESREGDRDWEMFAESAQGSQQSGEWILNKVRVLFYNIDGVAFTILGDTGTIDTLTRDLRIKGNVSVTSKMGYRFQTSAARYSSKKRLIESDDKVRMTAPSEKHPSKEVPLVLTGDKLEITVVDQKMVIRDHVKTEKTLADGRHLSLLADRVEATDKERRLAFKGHVETRVDSMKLESDEASMLYDKATEALQNVDIAGGVRMSDMNKYATANNVEFDPAQNRFTLKGHPRVVQNNDEITGDQIVFIDGGRKVQVEKMKAKMERTEE